MPDLIFHLGLTKTGSTFLQRRVFNGMMHTLDRSRPVWDDDRREAKTFRDFFHAHSPPVWRDPDVAERMLPSLNGLDTSVLISHETLYEHIPFYSDRYPMNVVAEPYLLAARLREIQRHAWPHGAVKAFFFFRRQADWLPSIYAQVCYWLDRPGQADFEERVQSLLANPNSGGQVLEYDLLLQTLQETLGPENVLALPYETFGNEDTWTRLRAFTGRPNLAEGVDFQKRDVNVKQRPGSQHWRASQSAQPTPVHRLPLVRWLRPLARRLLSGNSELKQKLQGLLQRSELRIEIPEGLATDVMAHYDASNRRCADLLGIDLSAYGYCTTDNVAATQNCDTLQQGARRTESMDIQHGQNRQEQSQE